MKTKRLIPILLIGCGGNNSVFSMAEEIDASNGDSSIDSAAITEAPDSAFIADAGAFALDSSNETQADSAIAIIDSGIDSGVIPDADNRDGWAPCSNAAYPGEAGTAMCQQGQTWIPCASGNTGACDLNFFSCCQWDNNGDSGEQWACINNGSFQCCDNGPHDYNHPCN